MTDTSRQNINGGELMEPKLSANAKYIAETRYSRKSEDGKPYETVKDIFWRVATNVAKGDRFFGVNHINNYRLVLCCQLMTRWNQF